MAFPAVESQRPTTFGSTGGAATSGSTASASHSVVLPATVSAGSLLMVVGRVAVADVAVSFPAGWTVVQDDSDASNDITFVAWRDTLADGTEDGASVTVTHGTGKMVAVSFSITDTANPASQTPELSTVAVGADGAPDPTSLSPTGGSKDYLWFWFGGWDGEASLIKTPATNYTSGDVDISTGISGAAATNCQIKVGYRQATAASEDPGAISAAENLGWAAYTIAVHPGGPSTVPGSAEIAVVADVVSVARRELIRAVDMAAAAAVVASGGRLGAVVARQASIDVTAAVVAFGVCVASRQAAVDATAGIAAAGARVPVTVSRQAAVDGTSSVDAVGGRQANVVTGQASLDATTAVAAVPQMDVQRQASLDATAAVDVVGARVAGIVTGQASIEATTATVAVGRAVLHAKAAGLDAAAAVTAAGGLAGATSTPVARVSLEPGGTPTVDTDHSVKVRARKQSGTGTVTLKAAVYEGASNRSGDLESTALTASVAEYALAIAEASAANITSYDDLELRFWGYSSTGDAVVVEVEEIWLETPEAVQIVTGQVSISAAGGVAASGQSVGVVARQAALSATADVLAGPGGTLAMALGGIVYTTVTSLVVPAGGIVDRSASLDATTTVAAVPQRVVQRQASVDATAGVAASPQRIVQRQVSVDAAAAVVSAPQRELLRSVDIAGVGDIQASGTALSAVATVRFTWIVLEVPGSAGITILQRQASLDATADIAAAGERQANVVTGQATISATADVSTAGRATLHARQASISSTADVTAAGIKAGLVTAQAAITATGSVTSTGRAVLHARQASVDATADVAASSSAVGIVSSSASIDAAATITVVPQRVLSRSADLTGSVSVDATHSAFTPAVRQLGNPVVTVAWIGRPDGLEHARGQGDLTALGHMTLIPDGMEHVRGQGTPTLSARVPLVGLVGIRAQGSPSVNPRTLSPAGQIHTRGQGAATVAVLWIARPDGLEHIRTTMDPTVRGHLFALPDGQEHIRLLGDPTVSGYVALTSLTRTRALGSPALNVRVLAPLALARA